MSGLKYASPQPVKKTTAKPSKTTTKTTNFPSEEFIVDSDDSGAAEGKPARRIALKTTETKSVAAPPKPIPAIFQEGKAQSTKPQKSPTPESTRDDSISSENGEDSGGDNRELPQNKKELPAQTNGSIGAKPKPVDARPTQAKSLQKLSINKESLGKPRSRSLVPRRSTSNVIQNARDNENEESGSGGSEIESENGSLSGSESESETKSSDQNSLRSPRKNSPTRDSSPSHSEPPTGFQTSKIIIHPSSKVAEILAPLCLDGKQIWHITTPASVPIASIKKISTQTINKGTSILSYKGEEYGLVSTGAEQAISRALFIPSAETNDYRPSDTKIAKTLHLQQIVSLPSHALDSTHSRNSTATVLDSYGKAPRPQPQGLKMRYHPFGASDGSESERPTQSAPTAPQFRPPLSVKDNSKDKKRKLADVIEDESGIVDSSVTSKKQRKRSEAIAELDEQVMDLDNILLRAPEMEGLIETSHKVDSGLQNENVPNGKEINVEKRKRKNTGKEREHQQSVIDSASALPQDIANGAEMIKPGGVVNCLPDISNNLSQQELKDEKMRRKDERKQDKRIRMLEGKIGSRESLVHVPVPDKSKLHISSSIERGSPKSVSESGQASPREETEEEKRKRKEKKRKGKEEKRKGKVAPSST